MLRKSIHNEMRKSIHNEDSKWAKRPFQGVSVACRLYWYDLVAPIERINRHGKNKNR
jgi:hypothetical protein